MKEVAQEAMQQTGKEMCLDPVGLRVHMQFKMPEKWTDQAQDLALAGKVWPPENLGHASHAFVEALRGVFYASRAQIVQSLITKAYGTEDAVHVSCWQVQ